jgi:hypothetical protein
MSTGELEGYVRHGRAHGTCEEFWQAAASDLEPAALRRLAAELGASLPSKWANGRNGVCEPASHAGSRVHNSHIRGNGRTPVVDSADGPQRACRDCGLVLPSRNRTGLCRRCYKRADMRRRRDGDGEPV